MRRFFILLEPPGVNRIPSVLTVFRKEFEAIQAFCAGNVNPFTATAVILFGRVGVVPGRCVSEVAASAASLLGFCRLSGVAVGDSLVVDENPIEGVSQTPFVIPFSTSLEASIIVTAGTPILLISA